jgi:hypothetical protein
MELEREVMDRTMQERILHLQFSFADFALRLHHAAYPRNCQSESSSFSSASVCVIKKLCLFSAGFV